MVSPPSQSAAPVAAPSLIPSPSRELVGRFVELMFLVTGIRPGPLQDGFIEHRLRARVRELGLPDFESYYERVAREFVLRKGTELEQFVDRVTTHETRFLRTATIWDFFSNTILREWWAQQSSVDRPLRVWSGAASSGEEAFTLAMILEDFTSQAPRFRWDVRASDISMRMIALGQDATYEERSLNPLGEDRLCRYFRPHREKGRFSVDHRLRQKVWFFQHNLLDPAPFQAEIDVALIRNVLMYFEPAARKRVLENVARTLSPGGYLILGEAESLLQAESLSEKPNSLTRSAFEFVAPSIYRRTSSPV